MVDRKQIISEAFDAITLLSHCSLEIGNRRRANVRNAFDPEIRDICDVSAEQIETSLLGEDFHKTVKDAKEMARIGHIAERPKHDNAATQFIARPHHQQSRPSSSSRENFLGRGWKPGPGPQKFRRRNNFQN
eukprot:gene959-275_t